MEIGLISDTHDDLLSLKSAIKIFNERKVKYVIHAGDYVFPGVVKQFKHLNAKLIGVLGNNDGEKIGLSRNFQEILSLANPSRSAAVRAESPARARAGARRAAHRKSIR